MGLEEGFREYWGWKVTLNELSDGNPLIEDEILKWNWIRFLNELAFRKEKNELEYELSKRNRGGV